ncbi:LysR family transcriptional regulator [Burkholderia sp. WAC0059]|uniref:LysR family transcriptional regulator n=1 Tax=Burkholderia sp. WAC0059 TaxID=2066022 RepID=UPI000C7F3655|nr:LysR family transcriptional regulator [Burkholderia sp. WAC0059]PLZ04013.1 LysR family transcriptional regulator [Burkholderia sp. WAC0059]
MDIRALRYFSEVVRQNGFRRASATLHVTQPAISRSISQLEDELEVELLVRTPKGVRLTPEGEVLYRHASLILRQVGNLGAELRDLRSQVTGTLRVGLPPMTGSVFFGDVITEFRRRYPGIQLQIAEYGTRQLESALAEGEVDIAAILLPVDGERFLTQTFVRDRLALLAARNHPCAGLRKVPLRNLAGTPFVAFTEDFKVNDLIDSVCRAQGFVPGIAGRSSHLDLIVSMVSSGMGVALLPATACRTIRSARLVTVPVVEPTVSYELALVRCRDTYVSRSCLAWIEVAAQVLGFKVDPSFAG